MLWLCIAIPIGVISAVRTGSWMDRLTMGLALIAISAPVYFLGLVALFLFDDNIGRFPLLPGSGAYQDAETFAGKAAALIMPWCVLAAAFAAIYARFLRGNLIDTMQEDYIRTARAKGLSERRVIFRHGVRSAITPIVTLLGLDIGILLGGAILTETVFNIPGIGRLRLRRHRAVRPSGHPGYGPVRSVLHRDHEPRRRHPLRLHRSAGAVLMRRRCWRSRTSASTSRPRTAWSRPSTASPTRSTAARRSGSSASPARASRSPRSPSWASRGHATRTSPAR